jgi:3-methyladenine DNA glycosylase AlkD
METIAQQKQELVRMIESVNNPEILDAVKNLLSDSERDLKTKQKMIFGALRSEEDFKAGRIYTREQVIERTNRMNK